MYNTVLIAESEKAAARRKKWIRGRDEYVLKGAYTALEAISGVDWKDIQMVHIDHTILHWTVLAELLLKLNPALEIIFFDGEKEGEEPDQAGANVFLIRNIPEKELNRGTPRFPSRCEPETERVPEGEGSLLPKLVITCFGGLSIQYNQKPVLFRTQKAAEILAYLVHNRNKTVHRDILIDALWPEMDADKGANNFHVNIYNLRSTLEGLGLRDIVKQSKGLYYLDAARTECDIWRFQDLVARMREQKECREDLLEAAAELFTGQYFEENAFPWAMEMQLKYERTMEEIQNKLYEYYCGKGQYKKAAHAMRVLIHMDPLSLEANEKCIAALLNLHEKGSAYKCLKELENKYLEEVGEPLPGRLRDLKKLLLGVDRGQLTNVG